jgi:hypothetical protein
MDRDGKEDFCPEVQARFGRCGILTCSHHTLAVVSYSRNVYRASS